MADTNELVERLSAAAGMIMEDSSPAALTPLPATSTEVEVRLDDLDHLPEGKQRELALVVQILFEEFEAVTARATQQWKKSGRILKVVLYGSYARGG